MEEKLPLVTVVVTTRNSAATIGECLKSIVAQSYPGERIEIVVIDNHSSDGTAAIAGEFTQKVFFKGPERSAQRNFGVEKGQGKYILYLDSDMSLSSEVVSQCVAKCEQEGFSALYIPERITGIGFWIKVRDFERSFYNATAIDCVRFIRKDKFLEVNGFDENMTGPEDWDFDRRIRKTGSVDIITAPIYHDEQNFDLNRYLRRKAYYSASFGKYVEKWGRNDALIRKQLGFYYRYIGVFIEKRKLLKLLAHPLLAGAMYFLRGLVGLVYILKPRIKYETE